MTHLLKIDSFSRVDGSQFPALGIYAEVYLPEAAFAGATFLDPYLRCLRGSIGIEHSNVVSVQGTNSEADVVPVQLKATRTEIAELLA